MPKNRVKKEHNKGIYFVTPTIWNWYYIFDRHNRWQILADSIKYCQKNKGLKVYAYVFMLNHLHLIIGSNDVAGFLRDFKKYTSKRLIENIKEFEPYRRMGFATPSACSCRIVGISALAFC